MTKITCKDVKKGGVYCPGHGKMRFNIYLGVSTFGLQQSYT